MKHRKNCGSSAKSLARRDTQKNGKFPIWAISYIYRISYYIVYVNFFFKFATLITGEPNKIESFATTGFEDNDPNCAVGYVKKSEKVT